VHSFAKANWNSTILILAKTIILSRRGSGTLLLHLNKNACQQSKLKLEYSEAETNVTDKYVKKGVTAVESSRKEL